jgi:hypothetical protein
MKRSGPNDLVSPALALLAASIAVVGSSPSYGQQAGDGSLRFEYQYIHTGPFDSSIGEIDIGHTDGHTILVSLDYAVTDRWSITASLPWIKKRHQGALPHNPSLDITEWRPPDLTLVDDGNYHSDFQDIYIGAHFLAKSGPLSIQPFFSFGVPTTNYQIYAHAALGRDVWHLPAGVAISFFPQLYDFYVEGDVSYVFTEKTLGVDISHYLLNGTLGYFMTPRIAPKIFFSMKHGTKGLDFPDDYDFAALNNERWYNHDRMIKHNFINAGIGVDWIINDRYLFSFSAFKMVDPDQVNIVERAWTASITYSFSRGRP